MNEFFTHDIKLKPGTKARAEDVNTRFDDIVTGFDKLPNPHLTETGFRDPLFVGDATLEGHAPTAKQIVSGSLNFVEDTGTANNYIVNLPIAPTAYGNGLQIWFRAKNANSGASTLAVDGLGSKSLTRQTGGPLLPGDILKDMVVGAVYNGTGFVATSYLPGQEAAIAAMAVTVNADKVIVAADKAIVAADKSTVIADKATVSTDKGIVAADKATVAADKVIVAADKALTITAKDQSVTAKDQSVTAKDQSVTARGLSESARDASIAAKVLAETAKTDTLAIYGSTVDVSNAVASAAGSAIAAQTAKGLSETARGLSESARDTSIAARDLALGYRDAAQVSAGEAESAANSLMVTKDAVDGVPGLTQFKVNFMNALGTVKSFFTNANTAERLYTFQNRDGIVADDTDLAGKQDALGFTPVQQGTGVGQTQNTVKLGWSAAGKLRATVDSVDQGYLVTENTLSSLINSRMPGSAGANGYQKFNNGITIQWGTFAHPASNPGYTVNFPIAFSNALSITFGSTSNGVEMATSLTNTGFLFYGGSIAKTVWFMAIGYCTPA